MMLGPIDFSRVVPAVDMKGEDDQGTAELKAMEQEAAAFLRGFPWCHGIEESFLGIGIPGVVAVFLFRQVPARTDVDPWLWVVVGDVPPAYITVDNAPNPASALDAYIGAMSEWVAAVKGGKPTDNLIPVNAPPTRRFAEMLDSRLSFIDREILRDYAADLT